MLRFSPPGAFIFGHQATNSHMLIWLSGYRRHPLDRRGKRVSHCEEEVLSVISKSTCRCSKKMVSPRTWSSVGVRHLKVETGIDHCHFFEGLGTLKTKQKTMINLAVYFNCQHPKHNAIYCASDNIIKDLQNSQFLVPCKWVEEGLCV